MNSLHVIEGARISIIKKQLEHMHLQIVTSATSNAESCK